MRTGRLPIDEQVRQFRTALSRNPTLAGVLTRAAEMSLPGWYLVAGCLYQTVWNVVTGQPPEAGILDYDLAYFDASDLSWEAEDAVIQAGRGVPCPPHDSAEAAIDTFEATTACLGVRAARSWRAWRRSAAASAAPPGHAGSVRSGSPVAAADVTHGSQSAGQ